MVIKCVKSTYEKTIFHISVEFIVVKLIVSLGNYITFKYETENPRGGTLLELVV